eukprot:scaffold7560_cov390-Prasinococcus_capsulatus_cf.AAC.4
MTPSSYLVSSLLRAHAEQIGQVSVPFLVRMPAHQGRKLQISFGWVGRVGMRTYQRLPWDQSVGTYLGRTRGLCGGKGHGCTI